MYIYYSMHHLSLCLCVCKSVGLFEWTSFFHSSWISFLMFLSVCVPLSQSMFSKLAGTWLNCAFCSTLVTWYGILSFPVVLCPIHQCICLCPGMSRIWENRCLSVPECFTLEVSKSSVSVSIIRSGDETAEAEPSPNGWCDLMRFAVDFASVSAQIVYDSYDCMICMVAVLRTSHMKLLPVTYTVVGWAKFKIWWTPLTLIQWCHHLPAYKLLLTNNNQPQWQR